jgi:mxaA protein
LKNETAMRWFVVAFFCFAFLAPESQAQVNSVSLKTPRLFGHFIGDVLNAEVDVRVDDGVELQTSSIPQPGSLNQWLELVSSRVETARDGAAKLYRIYLAYQTFYPALDARQLDIPGFTLSFASQSGISSAQVPGWSFGISPLREILPPAKASGGQYMQPDVLPPLYDVRREGYLAFGLLAATLGALALLAYHLAWWPFVARPHRPFTEAARVVRKALADDNTGRGYRDALVALHRAVDSTAGHAVFPEDLSSFLTQHPSFARLKEEFARFFASSQSLFFGDNPPAARAALSSTELRRFSDALVAAERAAS